MKCESDMFDIKETGKRSPVLSACAFIMAKQIEPNFDIEVQFADEVFPEVYAAEDIERSGNVEGINIIFFSIKYFSFLSFQIP